MEIKQEEVNKLSQLDRIEFRQRVEMISNKPVIIFFVGLMAAFTRHFFIASFLIVLGIFLLRKEKKKFGEIEEEYFETKVKRIERGIKK